MMEYLKSAQRQFEYYKQLGEKSMSQLPDEMLFWKANEEMNSIAIIVQHLWGNMLSRWTDFRTTDGEKPWRTRDTEFEHNLNSRADVLKKWDEGWACLFGALASIDDNDLEATIYIRSEAHSILEAINRQIAHYSYHVGQIVLIAKMLRNDQWQSLSIPRNQSDRFNAEKFNEGK